jgi:Bacterial PH domain
MIADSFSVLEVDEKGVRVRKWIGGKTLAWEEVGSARYGEVLQMVHGATSRECFLELRSRQGKKLLRLKSSYEPAAYECLIERARARNIPVDLGRG